MATLQQLQARRAELLAELERVDTAIAAFRDVSAVKLSFHRKIRNTPFVTTNPDWADTNLVIFEDEALSVLASIHSHEGFVSRSAWQAFLADHSDMEDLVWEVKGV